MSFVTRKIPHCDLCGHEWLLAVAAGQLPVHCAKCKTRRWNEGPQKPAPKRRRKAGRA